MRRLILTRAALARDATLPTDGIAGFRINHNLDLHIADFTVGTAARER
jgi:hypothetical protein